MVFSFASGRGKGSRSDKEAGSLPGAGRKPMSHIDFFADFAIVILVAALVTLLFRILRQPVVLGYILAGLIIGPHTPPFPLVEDPATIATLSQLGVIFLMFSLGLEFSLSKLRRVGIPSLFSGGFEVGLMLLLGYCLGRAFGWPLKDSLFLGAVLSISSTTLIVRAFSEQNLMKEPFALSALGMLIVEDLVAIVLIVVLTGVALTGDLHAGEIAETVGRMTVFLSVFLVFGLLAVPKLMRYVALLKSDEMTLLTVLGLCFGSALLASRLGYSVALGAFLSGAVLAETRHTAKVEALMKPLRDLFAAIFFVSVGLSIDPGALQGHWGILAAGFFTVVLGKFFATAGGVFLGGNDLRSALRVGFSTGQIGEFSFIIASLAQGVLQKGELLYALAIGISAATALTTPYAVKASGSLAQGFERHAPTVLLGYLHLYTRWLREFLIGSQRSAVKRILRRIAGQLLLFMTLIAGSLLAAAFFARILLHLFESLSPHASLIKSVFWLLAMFGAMPVYIASFRKMKALGLIVAEMGITEATASRYRNDIRAIVANGVLVLGVLLLFGLTALIGSAVLPPGGALVLLGLMVGFVAYLLRHSFNKVYFQGKASLVGLFLQSEAEEKEKRSAPALSSLSEARTRVFTVRDGSEAMGKTLRELDLLLRTGAYPAGVERLSAGRLGPDPDEDLKAGDAVLLIGTPAQLEVAAGLFGKREGVSGPAESERAAAR